MQTQKEKAEVFNALHHNGRMLVLPNIWDPLGAALLQDLGYPAIATASASIAYTNGYNDGENIPFNDLLLLLKKITAGVSVPVTADIESGFAHTNTNFEKNIELLIHTGIAGINLEDSDRRNDAILPVDVQCRRIQMVKKVAALNGVPLFCNARTDVYLYPKDFTGEPEKLAETIRRGMAYKDAGADCFFPVLMTHESSVQKIVQDLNYPVNIVAISGVPGLKILQDIGVARVSLGPGFLKIAIRTMKEVAQRLQSYEGFDDITNNVVTSDYLKELVSKK